MGQTLEECKKAAVKADAKNDARFTWVPADFLEKHNVSAWGDMPLWVPPAGEMAAMHLRSNERAVKAGLKYRPVEQTASGILAWWPKELERRKRVGAQMIEDAKKSGAPEPQLPNPEKLRGGIDAEREKEVLAAWHAEKAAPATKPA